MDKISKLEMLKGILKKEKIISSNDIITTSDKLYMDMDDVVKCIENLHKQYAIPLYEKPIVSMRLGMIIVCEEYLQIKKKNGIKNPRIGYTFKICYRSTSIRFKLEKNRNKVKFKHSMELVHPEDPCKYYEDKERSRGQYESVLRKILYNKSWLIEEPMAKESLEVIYNEVKLCKNK